MKIFISGDFAPGYRTIDLIQKGEYASLFNDIINDIRSADLAITNLESPLVEEGTPITKTGPNLKAPLKSLEALKYAGFHLVTLANNHIMDYGSKGLLSSMETCKKAGIEYVGVGENFTEASFVKVMEVKGQKLAIINVCENEWSTTHGEEPGANPLDEVSIFYQIQEAKAKADYILLIVHGGHETYGYPSPRMKKLYRWFIDLGVDAVIGHHTHCYSGRESYKGKPIVYSLGNFVFDHPTWNDNFWTKACACILNIDNDSIKVEMIPFHQCDTSVGIHLYNRAECKAFAIEDKEKTSLIQDEAKLQIEYDKFLNKQQKMFGAFVEPFSNTLILGLKKLHLLPSLLKPSKRLLLLNLIRCEAHRDILLNHLKRTSTK